MPSKTSPRFPIGTKFRRTAGKRKNRPVETVTDYLRTFNNAGELVAVRYVATHDFLGQVVTDRDVLETTIARSELIETPITTE